MICFFYFLLIYNCQFIIGSIHKNYCKKQKRMAVKNNRGKEKGSEYYQANKDIIKEKPNSKYKNVTEERKEAKKSITRIGIKNKRKCKLKC